MSALNALKAEAQGLPLFLEYKDLKLEVAPLSEELANACIMDNWVSAARLLFTDQYQSLKKVAKKGKQLEQAVTQGIELYGVSVQDLAETFSVLNDDTYCKKLEYDFLRLGLDLRDYLSDVRRLVLIYTELEDSSSVKKAIAGKPAEWDRKEYMLADIADMLNMQTILLHINAQMQGLKKPIKSPGSVYKRPENPKPKVFNKTADLSRLIGGIHG